MPTPLPPAQANPELLEMLVKLMLGTDVTDPLGPSPGVLGAMVPGAARGARGLVPQLQRAMNRRVPQYRVLQRGGPQLDTDILAAIRSHPTSQRRFEDTLSRVAQYLIRSRDLPTTSPYPNQGYTAPTDLLEALRSFKQARPRPLESARRVPATTPARERLANPLPEASGKLGWNPGESGDAGLLADLMEQLGMGRGPGLDDSAKLVDAAHRAQELRDKLTTPGSTRNFSPKQLAMLDEIKVSMQKLLRSGLPAEDTPRQMLPAEMSDDLARRYGAASRRLRGMGPQFRGNPQNPGAEHYSEAVSEARDLGDPRGGFTDAGVLEGLVEEILARFLGRLAPRQRPYMRTAAEDVNRGVVPRVTHTTPGGLDYWAGAPGDSRFGQ